MNFIIYLFAVLKNVIYGLSVFFIGNLSAEVAVMDILALRYLLSFVVFWLLKQTGVIKIRVGIKDFVRKNERTPFLKSVLLTSLFEPVLYMFFETLGISMTTGITAAVILSLAPVTSCICEELFLKERTTLLQKLFLALGIAGVIYIAVHTESSQGKDSLAGILLVLAAVLSGSLFCTFSRKSSEAFSAMEITYVTAAVGMIVFNAVNVCRHLFLGTLNQYFAPYLHLENLMGFVFLGVFCTIAATWMNNYALARMQISTMAAFGGLSTLVTIAAGVLLGGEQLYLYHGIGLVLIVSRMVGVSYIQIRKQKKAGS